MEWQPIETAPHTSSDHPVLLGFSRGAVSVAYWDAYHSVNGRGYEPGVLPWVEPVSGEPLSKHYGSPVVWTTLPALAKEA